MIKGKRYFPSGLNNSEFRKGQEPAIPLVQSRPSEKQIEWGFKPWEGDRRKLKTERRATSWQRPADPRDAEHFGVFPHRWRVKLTRSEIFNWVMADPRLRKAFGNGPFLTLYRAFIFGERTEVASVLGLTLAQLTTFIDENENWAAQFVAEGRKRLLDEKSRERNPTAASLAAADAADIVRRREELLKAGPPSYLRHAVDHGWPKRLAEGFRGWAFEFEPGDNLNVAIRRGDVVVHTPGVRVRKSGKVYKRGRYDFHTPSTTRSKAKGADWLEWSRKNLKSNEDED
jgi:hypothetical protein